MTDKIKVPKETQLFKGLDDAVLKILADRSIVKRLKRNEILFV